VDRDNPKVAKLYDPQHPAVVWALARVAQTARAAGKTSSVCGEMAGDYATALMMVGLGFDSVSVVPQLLPEVKYAVRETSCTEAREIAAAAAAQTTSEGVERVLAQARERLHRRNLDGLEREATLEGAESSPDPAGEASG
jgi:phosphotransferase system enzyme I (PtsP)